MFWAGRTLLRSPWGVRFYSHYDTLCYEVAIMYVKAKITRVTSATDKCTCGNGMKSGSVVIAV